MRPLIALATIVALGCGDGSVDNEALNAWNDAVDDYVAATCVDLELCTSEDPATCEADARDALADVRTGLAEEDRQACVDCLLVLAQQNHDLSATCDPDDIDMDAITAACGADDESCAGFPP